MSTIPSVKIISGERKPVFTSQAASVVHPQANVLLRVTKQRDITTPEVKPSWKLGFLHVVWVHVRVDWVHTVYWVHLMPVLKRSVVMRLCMSSVVVVVGLSVCESPGACLSVCPCVSVFVCSVCSGVCLDVVVSDVRTARFIFQGKSTILCGLVTGNMIH